MESKLATRNLFWVGCFPSKTRNIGDHALTYAVQKILELQFADYKIYRFSRTEVEKFFKCRINKNDLIFIHSAGNFGDLYNFHKIRKQIIASYPDNLIVQLPVSIHYESAVNFENDKLFFDRKNILILTRTLHESKLLKANFNCKVQYFPDFVYSIDPHEVKKNDSNKTSREGVLFVLRKDSESMLLSGLLSKALKKFHRPLTLLDHITRKPVYRMLLEFCINIEYKNMANWLKRRGYAVKDTQTSDVDITDENREKIIFSTLNYYKRYKLIITDRFHAGIFCRLTNTPFKMLSSKIKGKKVIEIQDTKKYFDTFRELIEENKKLAMS